MGELVKYHNHINKIPLRKFTEKEIDLFFSFIFKMRDISDDTLEIDIKELCKLSGIKSRSKSRIYNQLEKTYDKILNLDMRIETEESILKFNLFRHYEIKKDKNAVNIQIESKFKYLLNELIGNYTKFELEQLVSFKSSYSKNIFRLLKQFESTNFFTMSLEEFRRILCIPDTYKNYDIERRVFKPAIEELLPIFPNLKLEKIMKGRSTIDQLKFTWENKDIKEAEKTKEIKISEKLNKIIEKARKNRFIQHFLSVDNIEKMIEKYSEEDLIKGLNVAHKNVKTEIKSLKYIEETIDSAIKEPNKKIVVKKVHPQDLQSVEPKVEEQEELTKETRESTRTQYEEVKKEFMDLSKEDQKEVERMAFEFFVSDYKIDKPMSLHKKIFKTLRGNYINRLI